MSFSVLVVVRNMTFNVTSAGIYFINIPAVSAGKGAVKVRIDSFLLECTLFIQNTGILAASGFILFQVSPFTLS